LREIYFVRHGETNANVEKICCGYTDIDINENGIKQAKNVSKILSEYNIDLIYSSDLIRTKTTAEEINKYHNINIKYLSELREMNFGVLEGLTFNEIGESYPEEKEKIIDVIDFDINYKFSEGESLNMLYKRVNKTFNDIMNKNPDKNILIVSHGGAIKSILTKILSGDINRFWSVEIENCKTSTVVDNNGFLYLKNLNRL
jgi:broad specificity phosphatase PhoE